MALLRDFRRFPLSVHLSDPLLQAAWEVAHALDRSFYDSIYLALAAALDCPLVPADLKLWNALQGGLTRASLLWVEEIS
jgi:predicted nucleic acid-binding protein